MAKVLKIAVWEFIEKARRKSFILSMFLTPLLFLGLGLIPSLFTKPVAEIPRVIGILDETNTYFKSLQVKLSDYSTDNFQPRFILINVNKDSDDLEASIDYANTLIKEGGIRGYLFLRPSESSLLAEFVHDSTISLSDINLFKSALDEILTEKNLIKEGIPKEKLDTLLSDINLKKTILHTQEDHQKNILAIFFASYVLILLLLMLILFSGGMLVRSLVEEKSNRIIEILLSSCTVEELLLGKITGLGLLGLFQIIIWTLIGMIIYGVNIIPHNLFDNFSLQILYFILCYFFYSAIFIGLGSIVSTEHEAQQMTGYVSIMLIFPILISIEILQHPNSSFATIIIIFPLDIRSGYDSEIKSNYAASAGGFNIHRDSPSLNWFYGLHKLKDIQIRRPSLWKKT